MKLLPLALTSSLALSSLIAGAFEENLQSLLQTKTGMSVKVVKSYPLEGLKDLKFVAIESVASAQRFPIFASTDGKNVIGFSNLFFTQSNKNDELIQSALKEIQNFNENAKNKKLAEIFNALPKDRYISLRSSKSDAKTIFVVTDPECPYCRNEMKLIEEKLKENHLNIIFAPVHARSSFIKSQIAMDRIKEAKNDKQKIAILKEVYSEDYKIPEKLLQQPTPLIEENAKTIFNSGLIRGVPFIFEMK